MASRNAMVLFWVCVGVLVLLFGTSMSGTGTWMGGIGMGWMMGIPVLLLAGAVWFAYSYGRMSQKVDELSQRKE